MRVSEMISNKTVRQNLRKSEIKQVMKILNNKTLFGNKDPGTQTVILLLIYGNINPY